MHDQSNLSTRDLNWLVLGFKPLILVCLMLALQKCLLGLEKLLQIEKN
jgi:hypothetical protein